MREYLTEAIVLDCEPYGDLDLRLPLFTRRFGKLVARAKSARKITSKLASHLEPGNLIQARLVEKNGLQVVDALKKSRLDVKPVDLYFLNILLPEAEPDAQLWQELHNEFSWPRTLKILGWDPERALCSVCGQTEPEAFNMRGQGFLCKTCSSKFGQNELLLIYR